jgi:acyl-CoA synthetase (AMP-forming)/AMP-acid ligase II
VSALVARFAHLLTANPARPLIYLPAAGESLTVNDVWRAHLGFAEALGATGLRPGQLLLLAVGNRAAAVPLLLAARALGAAVLPVDLGTTAAEVAELADRFGAAAILVPAGAAPDHRGVRHQLPDGLELIARDTPHAYGETALLKLTSGSTGLPKAARTTDAQLISDSEHIVAAMGIGPADTQITVIPLSHAYGVSVILVPLIIQGTAMVLREGFVPHQLPADARAYGATTFPGVPFMFEYFLAHPPADGWPPGLHRLVSAGARLPPETVRGFHERFGVRIHSFYGASESGGISYDASDSVDDCDTVGWPLPEVTITFRPDPETPLGMGRVHVASTSVAGGYVGEPSAEFTDGGFLTGDYGMFDGQGRLRLTGRVSSFINVAGKKVQPAEVEDVLRQMPGVRDVRVIGGPDEQRGEQVVACVAVEKNAAATVNALTVRRFCSARLAAHKIPRTIVVLDAIPLTARGKTDRRALEQRARAAIAGFPQQLC